MKKASDFGIIMGSLVGFAGGIFISTIMGIIDRLDDRVKNSRSYIRSIEDVNGDSIEDLYQNLGSGILYLSQKDGTFIPSDTYLKNVKDRYSKVESNSGTLETK